jgi:hypothetical protein
MLEAFSVLGEDVGAIAFGDPSFAGWDYKCKWLSSRIGGEFANHLLHYRNIEKGGKNQSPEITQKDGRPTARFVRIRHENKTPI